MAENTTTCRNGELQPGDLVIAAPGDDYALMVGRVLSIIKAGTHEHDAETGNPGDSIHVDFMDAAYSENRLREIEQQLGELYGRPTTPGIMPPIDVDDVIMEQDMLYRITGIGREELEAILDSGENAAAYAKKLDGGLQESSVGEDARKQELFEKLDRNLTHNLNHLHGHISIPLSRDELFHTAQSIVANFNAHGYLTKDYEFRPGDIESLLRLQNPLDGIAEEWPVGTGLAVLMDAVVHEALDGREELEAGPISADALAAGEQPSGKPSVMEQIRQAREEAKNNPAPHKDAPGKGREPEL
jgi:hypothetical protein